MTKITKAVEEGRLDSVEVVQYLERRQNERHIVRMAGEIASPGALIEKLLGIRLVLAGRCLVEATRRGRPVDPRVRDRVIDALVAACDGDVSVIGKILVALTTPRLWKLIKLVALDEPVLLTPTLTEYLEIFRNSDTASLLLDLDSPDAKVRVRAVLGLGVFADTKDFPVERLLAVYNNDSDIWVKIRAEFALGMMYDEEISKKFAKILDATDDESVVERILWMAKRAGDVGILVSWLSRGTIRQREIALEGLIRARSEDPRALAAIRRACEDSAEAIRARAREALREPA